MNTQGVKIENIIKEFVTNKKTVRAVDNISLNIEAGKLVTLLGPSGCGKTTMLRMIAGLEIPTSGNIYIGDELVTHLPPNKRDTAMVFQSYAIFPHYTVAENIAYGLKIKKMNKSEIDKKVDNIIELVGLNGLAERNPSQLSGGQQQRVALARALVMEPSVLLFDEPLSNLDAKLRVYMRTEIRNIQQRLGLTSIYVTHDQAEAMSLSDNIIIMNKGKIEQIGSPKEIYQKPKTKFVADFIGVANFIPAQIEKIQDSEVSVKIFDNFQTMTMPERNISQGEKVDLVIRPEGISIDDTGKFSAKVIHSIFMGNVQDYVLDFYGQELMVETANPIDKKIYRPGETVGVNFAANSIHML